MAVGNQKYFKLRKELFEKELKARRRTAEIKRRMHEIRKLLYDRRWQRNKKEKEDGRAI